MIISFLFLFFLIFLPLLIENSKKNMGETERAYAPGNFVSLSKGLVHYRWFGEKHNDLVVCVHGLTTPSFVFESLAEYYVKIGKCVLVFDNYGRGYSDRPKGKQDKEFFINQLDELLDKLDLNKEKFELVGYSMGGSIASAYAARNPDKLKKLTLLASAGMMHNLGFLAKAAKFPIFGRFLFFLFYGLLHKRSTEKERMLTSSVPNIVERQQNELNFKGFLPSVLASIKGILSSNSYEDHIALKDVNFPILAIWGGVDSVIPISCKDILISWNPKIKNIVIPLGTHSITYTHAQEIIKIVKSSG